MLLLPRPETRLPSPHPADKLTSSTPGYPPSRYHPHRAGDTFTPSWKDSSGRGPRRTRPTRTGTNLLFK